MWTFEWMNATAGVNQKCIESWTSAKQTWRCFFAQYTSPHIKTPVFPLQSQYDSWQIHYDLDSTDNTDINNWGKALTAFLKSDLLSHNPQSGVFLDACEHHCGNWNSMLVDGLDQAHAFERWYNGDARKVYEQNHRYKCDACCTRGDYLSF